MYATNLRNVSEITEQVQLAENRAAQLTEKLEELKQANETAELRMGELMQEREALEARVTQLECQSRKILLAQPEAIVGALKDWLQSDPKGLARALHNFIGGAVS
jgi:chromosome segregation ATPase